MGKMIEGTWRTDSWVRDNEGHFEREPTSFRDTVKGDAGARYPATADRYHLYVSLACPWAHRTLIARALMGLEHAVDVSVVHPHMLADGWTFESDFPTTTGNLIGDHQFLRHVYREADPQYTGRVTVPVLWDRQAETIVNNESREIIRMFSTAFADLAEHPVDLWPEGHRDEVDRLIDAIYEPVNNGVYRAGFATTQQAYEESVTELFEALEHWNEHLGRHRYLCGDVFTEADICLFTTLLRFDPVYYGHFKCNLRHVYEYEHLWSYTREIYQLPGVAETCHLDHIQSHYYYSHETINPTRVVPLGPNLDRLADPGRDHLPGQLLTR